jgi:hypothetical protein
VSQGKSFWNSFDVPLSSANGAVVASFNNSVASLARQIREEEPVLAVGHRTGLERWPSRILEPDDTVGRTEGEIVCRERLGGLLKHYHRRAA